MTYPTLQEAATRIADAENLFFQAIEAAGYPLSEDYYPVIEWYGDEVTITLTREWKDIKEVFFTIRLTIAEAEDFQRLVALIEEQKTNA